MRKSTDMPMFHDIDDDRAEAAPRTAEGYGAYLLLLTDYWRNGPPPDDDAALAAIARLTPERWARLRPTMLGLFAVRDGRWRHAGVDAARQRASGEPRKRAARGRHAPESGAAATGTSVDLAPADGCGDGGLTPLEAMLATMRWAHREAEAASARARELGGLAGKEARDAAEAVIALRALALDAAKALVRCLPPPRARPQQA